MLCNLSFPNGYECKEGIAEEFSLVYFPMTSEQRIDGKNEGLRILMTASI